MSFIDWTIVIVMLSTLTIVGVISKRYMKSVADFLVAGRGIGRFLGQTTGFAEGIGAVSIVAIMQAVYVGGWVYVWSRIANVVILMIIAISGFGVYRLRETRVMTINELLERRYSRKLRIFAGMLCFISGTLNMAIFPYVAANFFSYFLGLPEYIMLGTLQIPTYWMVMTGILVISVWLSFVGGQVTLLATDYIQGSIMLIMVIVVGFVIYRMVNFDAIHQAVMSMNDPHTMLNPFRSKSDFGFSFVMMSMALTANGVLCWAPNMLRSQGARDAREAKAIYMFGLLRIYVVGIALFAFVPMAALAIMKLPAFSGLAAIVQTSLSSITNEKMATQLVVPMVLKNVFPIGMIGLFIASMIAASISTHDSYLLSWAGVFIQDVVLPIRNKPLPQKQHIAWLRWATIGVAVFIYIFSMFYKPKDYIIMFMMVTGAIYTGGAGTIILGALYWKRATTAGAWAAMITGSALAVSGLILKQVWEGVAFLTRWKSVCPFNGIQVYFIAVVMAAIVFVAVSLLTPNRHFDLAALLHRKKQDNSPEQKDQITCEETAKQQ